MRPLAGFLRLLRVASGVSDNVAYRVEGRMRQHCPPYLFQYSLSGKGWMENADGQYSVPTGSGFLVKVSDPDLVYGFPNDAGEPWTFLWVAFDGGMAQSLVREMTTRNGPVFSLDREHPIIQEFLAFEGRPAEEDITAGRSAEYVTRLLTALSDAADKPGAASAARELVHEVQALIDQRLHDNLNVKKLAAALGVSREYLARVYKAETGYSLHEHILRRKVYAACDLLKDTKLSHAKIAERLGFGTGTHFARVFKQVTRIAPRQYRALGTLLEV